MGEQTLFFYNLKCTELLGDVAASDFCIRTEGRRPLSSPELFGECVFWHKLRPPPPPFCRVPFLPRVVLLGLAEGAQASKESAAEAPLVLRLFLGSFTPTPKKEMFALKGLVFFCSCGGSSGRCPLSWFGAWHS